MSLPIDPNSLGQQLKQANDRNKSMDSDMPFLKMDKTGHWVYGADEIEVQDGSFWAVNPTSFMEGYIAWGEGEVLGEEMAPMTDAPILVANLPSVEGSKRGWEKQIGCQLVCLNGDDQGTQVFYKVSSKGGIKALRGLIDSVVDQIGLDPTAIVAKVSLKNDSYKHKQYGKIYTPVFQVSEWLGNDAGFASEEVENDAPDETDPEPEAEEPKPARRRRAVAS